MTEPSSFHILDYPVFRGRVLDRQPPRRFALEYFGTVVSFQLDDDGDGGTDLSLVAGAADESSRMEFAAGWVSVLLAMKAAVSQSGAETARRAIDWG